MRDQFLVVIVWLRRYPIHEVLGFFFGISDSTVSRLIDRLVPVLEAAGCDTMRMPDPGKAFEQRVQRPPDRQAADNPARGSFTACAVL
jgi:hypothetical protein